MLAVMLRRETFVAIVQAVVVVAVFAACTPAPEPGDPEEIATSAEKVPEAVSTAAADFGARAGGARCEAWYWDTESEDWECTFVGLDRQAELDVTSEGGFSELELVYEFAEVAEALPDVADLIRGKCHDENGVFIELSLRRDVFLDDIPSLEEAWKASGVVLEFQCASGRDFEVDARKMMITSPVDDTTDSETGR